MGGKWLQTHMTQISENCMKTIMLVDTEFTSALNRYTSS